jgi:hypothetical protein
MKVAETRTELVYEPVPLDEMRAAQHRNRDGARNDPSAVVACDGLACPDQAAIASSANSRAVKATEMGNCGTYRWRYVVDPNLVP